MKVKIDEKLICIPPYISTTWDQVTFLQSEEDTETHLFTLIIHLNERKSVSIPNLDSAVVEIAFAAHIKYLERRATSPHSKGGEEKTFGGLLQQITGLSTEQLNNMPIRLGISGIEGMPGIEVMQHNQAQGNAPDMPAEMVEKISNMIKLLTNGDTSSFPKPEPHCNCPHCQIARSLHDIEKGVSDQTAEIDLPVPDEELKFREWDITKKGDKLYLVSNPLDPKEHYNVYLGSPIGCTCGHTHCEHIKAVLYS